MPVVAIDRQVTGTSLATVEADNLLIGQQMGEMYLKTLGDKEGKVLIVGGPLSSSATVNRTEGFKAAIKDARECEDRGRVRHRDGRGSRAGRRDELPAGQPRYQLHFQLHRLHPPLCE